MSNKSDRLYFIQNNILPQLTPRLSKSLLFTKAKSVNMVHHHLENANFHGTLRNTRRDLAELELRCRISKCTQSGKVRYFVEKDLAESSVINNLPHNRTLLIGDDSIAQNDRSFFEVNGYPLTLSDQQLTSRFIEKHGFLAVVPNETTRKTVAIIKEALRTQNRLTFNYHKHADSGLSQKEVNPIGIINDCGNYLLIATSVSFCTKHARRFKISKMFDLSIEHDKKLFPQISHSDAHNALHNGGEDYVLSHNAVETVDLKLTKDAAHYFSANTLEGATNWNFEWENNDRQQARLTFNAKISVNLLRGLSSFTKSIEILGSEKLIKAIEIQENSDPYQRKIEMLRLFGLVS